MERFEELAKDYFGEIIINKSLIHNAGFNNRAIPAYVSEWIIANYVNDEQELDENSLQKIANFIQKYVPPKQDKEAIKNKLFEQSEIKILDNFSVRVNLNKGDRYLSIPYLDESSGNLSARILDDNEMLLKSGLWGVGTLFYTPPDSNNSKKGQIWMKEFKPFQLSNIDIEYFCYVREHFTTEDWINLIISSMGFNYQLYNEEQKILLIARLISLVVPRYNLIELAPKGTGKSFVFDNISRYIAVRSGKITPSVLFFDDNRKLPGLITRYDSVVIDEAQKVKTDSSGELTALLKSYLESGKFGRGSSEGISAEAGLILLANIDIDDNRSPVNEKIGIFRSLPNFLKETAFIDRFAALLPGWKLPRISKDSPSKYLGLKGDIFGEILHILRNDVSYSDYVRANMELINNDDMRDNKAIQASCSGLLKIIFPNKKVEEEEFYKYCVNPAIELRQRIRDELCKLDPEYQSFTIKSKMENEYQKNHKPPRYYKEDEEDSYPNAEYQNLNSNVVDENTNANIENKNKIVVAKKKVLIAKKIAEDNNIKTSILDENRNPIQTEISIKENDTGYSYKNLFYPYLKKSKKIKVVDPYIKEDYQIKYFSEFCEILISNENLKLELVTKGDFNRQKDLLNKIKNYLAGYNITFEIDFDGYLHDRYIETDDGWKIVMGRGLDIFKGSNSLISDQTIRGCRKCSFQYLKKELFTNS